MYTHGVELPNSSLFMYRMTVLEVQAWSGEAQHVEGLPVDALARIVLLDSHGVAGEVEGQLLRVRVCVIGLETGSKTPCPV